VLSGAGKELKWSFLVWCVEQVTSMASCWYNEGMCGDAIGIPFYCSVVAHLVPDALASVQDVVQEALQAWCHCEKLEKVDHKGSIVTLNLLGRSRAHAWRLQEFLGLASTCFE